MDNYTTIEAAAKRNGITAEELIALAREGLVETVRVGTEEHITDIGQVQLAAHLVFERYEKGQERGQPAGWVGSARAARELNMPERVVLQVVETAAIGETRLLSEGKGAVLSPAAYTRLAELSSKAEAIRREKGGRA